MRVIAGKARSIPLQSPEGYDTRPTTDRIKETLFNMLQSKLKEARFLDLFAGSGGIGIEALSRGAACCVFIEKDPKALQAIEANLDKTKLRDKAKVLGMDIQAALRRLQGEEGGPFDLIFMDPPYGKGLVARTLGDLQKAGCVGEESLLIAEMEKGEDSASLENDFYEILKIKEYKSNKHVWLKRRT